MQANRQRLLAPRKIMLNFLYSAPVAQLDRASGYEPEGREFESLRAHHLLHLHLVTAPRNLREFHCHDDVTDHGWNWGLHIRTKKPGFGGDERHEPTDLC